MNKSLKQRRKFTKEEKQLIYAKTDCKCGHCGRILEQGESTIDHIIPLHKGGLNDEYVSSPNRFAEVNARFSVREMPDFAVAQRNSEFF